MSLMPLSRHALRPLALAAILACPAGLAWSQSPASASVPASAPASAPAYDAALAEKLGADARGMRRYVLVILKTGPQRMPDGPARQALFEGHFANMKRLTELGVLKVAGPADGVDGWRGIFLMAVPSIDEAKAFAATDPVLKTGEMVAEYHVMYLSAALMASPDLHQRLVPPAAKP